MAPVQELRWIAYDGTAFVTEQEAIDYDAQALENLKRDALRAWFQGLSTSLPISQVELMVEAIIDRTIPTAETELNDINNLTLP